MRVLTVCLLLFIWIIVNTVSTFIEQKSCYFMLRISQRSAKNWIWLIFIRSLTKNILVSCYYTFSCCVSSISRLLTEHSVHTGHGAYVIMQRKFNMCRCQLNINILYKHTMFLESSVISGAVYCVHVHVYIVYWRVQVLTCHISTSRLCGIADILVIKCSKVSLYI